MTAVNRQTRCILGWSVVWTRTQEALTRMVGEAPKANWYYSDGFDAYQWFWYHFGRYEVSEGKTDTNSVEGDNAELRHFLARLVRSHDSFRVAPMPWNVPCVCSCSVSIDDNFTSNNIRTIPLI